MIQAAALAGASRIIAIDPNAARLTVAERLGATALDPTHGLVEQVMDLTDGFGVDVALEAAGQMSVAASAYEITRGGGTVVVTGMESPHATVNLNNFGLVVDAKTVIGSQTGGGDIIEIVPRYARLLDEGKLNAEAILTNVYDLESTPRALDAMRSGLDLTGVVVTSGSDEQRQRAVAEFSNA
jgi:S-(hydroxymethyl)glutathione dehydrogenase/alcohol dehydrogenase